MELKTNREIRIEKKDLIELINNKMPDLKLVDISGVDSGGFENDGYILVYL